MAKRRRYARDEIGRFAETGGGGARRARERKKMTRRVGGTAAKNRPQSKRNLNKVLRTRSEKLSRARYKRRLRGKSRR